MFCYFFLLLPKWNLSFPLEMFSLPAAVYFTVYALCSNIQFTGYVILPVVWLLLTVSACLFVITVNCKADLTCSSVHGILKKIITVIHRQTCCSLTTSYRGLSQLPHYNNDISANLAQCGLMNPNIRYSQTNIKIFLSTVKWRSVST